jgi:hypothetical protein
LSGVLSGGEQSELAEAKLGICIYEVVMLLFDVGELLLDLLEFLLMGLFFALHEGFQLLLPIFLPFYEILLLLSPKRLLLALEGTHLIIEQRFKEMLIDLMLVVALQLGLEFVSVTVSFEFFFDDFGDLFRAKSYLFFEEVGGEIEVGGGGLVWLLQMDGVLLLRLCF